MSTKTGLAPVRQIGAGGGEEAVGGGDHLVPRPDPQRHQGQEQGVGPRRAADRVPEPQ